MTRSAMKSPATEGNGGSYGQTQGAVRPNPKSERATRDEQAGSESGREQTLDVVHHNYRITVLI